MFKKLNLTTLIITFVILLALVLLSQMINRHKGERNFKSQLFKVDTAKISSIAIKTKTSKQELTLVKKGKNWTISAKGKTYQVDPGTVKSMIAEIGTLRAQREVAVDPSEWSNFDVTDSVSTHVKVKQGGKTVADFLVGKFSYNQYPQRFTTYLRLEHENEVYATEGFLSMTFSKGLNDLRIKTLVGVPSGQITRLKFTYPADSSFELLKDKKGWKINGMDADSGKVASYVNNLSYMNGNEFIGDEVKSGTQVYSLKIEGNNFNPIEIKAFSADTAFHCIIASSVNPDARFSGISSDIANRIFTGKKQFEKKK